MPYFRGCCGVQTEFKIQKKPGHLSCRCPGCLSRKDHRQENAAIPDLLCADAVFVGFDHLLERVSRTNDEQEGGSHGSRT